MIFYWITISTYIAKLSCNSCRQLAQAVSVPVGRHSGSKLATPLVATISNVINFSCFSSFPHFYVSSVVYFSQKSRDREPFRTSLAILMPTRGHFGFCRGCGIAGGERVPPSPLGWYLSNILFLILGMIPDIGYLISNT